MQPVSPKYICWKCGNSYKDDFQFCGRCGADMKRASRLDLEAQRESSPSIPAVDGRRPTEQLEARQRRMSDYDPWMGRVIDNRYRIVEVVGQGGMGVVYKVEHQRMGKIAALKMLHRELAHDAEVVGRFHIEAEAVSRLTHHNTVQVFDFGLYQGSLYLVMEYVSGTDIGRLVDRDGPMSTERALPLFAQICAALNEAHDQGVIHRDLKPENVLVTRTHRGRDFVKVLDFGLAKLSESEEASSVTGRGMIVGTPYYMSPEQIRGEEIDARSDIYSLGGLMYRALTGEPPFEAKTPVGVLTKHLTDELVPPSARRPDLNIDKRLDDIISRTMAKKAADRYPSANALLEELEQMFGDVGSSQKLLFMSGPTAAAPNEPLRVVPVDEAVPSVPSEQRLNRADIDRFESKLLRRRRLQVATVPLLIAAIGGGAYSWLVWRSSQPNTVEAEPNNSLDTPTLIGRNMPVTGHIGRRLTDDVADRDFYRLLDGPRAEGGDTVSIHVASQKNIDMIVELFDNTGKRLATANSAGTGGDEWLRRMRISGAFRIMVTEVDHDGFPTESITDHYTLTVTVDPEDDAHESEPNDLGADANPVGTATAVSAHLDRPHDIDMFRFTGAPGEYEVEVTAEDGVPIQWAVGHSAPSKNRRQVVGLTAGAVIRLSLAEGFVPTPETSGYQLTVRRP